MLVSGLRLAGPRSAAHLDAEALASLTLPDGGRLPSSYVAFVEHAGWARTFGLWLVYPPVLPGWADGLQGRGGALTTRMVDAFLEAKHEDFDWVIEPDGSWELIPALRVFAWSENGDALFWDTSSRDARGEYRVFCSSRGQNLALWGSDLEEALDRMAAARFGDAPDLEPLTPTRVED